MEPIVVVPYQEKWKEEFQIMAEEIRKSLGEIAIRIDHIGSTAVDGLDSKPVIDIQISMQSMEPMIYKPLLERIGYRYRNENPDKTKKYFRESDGRKRTHIHVREHGSWSEQFALLFRDFLRISANDRKEYADVKRHLAILHRDDRSRYVEEKASVIWKIMMKADQWSQQTGWKPGNTDA